MRKGVCSIRGYHYRPFQSDLLRSIEDQRDEWEKQMITYQEQEIEMEQKSLNLKQQALTNNYELERLKKSIALDREEFQMGVKSKAQLQVAEDEYNYKLKKRGIATRKPAT